MLDNKKYMFNNKKAVSPIIAAVLLVVITIAIGATTMAFIRSLADTNLESANEQATRISCGSDLTLKIPVVNNVYKICYNSSTGSIDATLHNTGTKDVKGFQMTVIFNNGTATTNSSTGVSISKNTYQKMSFVPYGGNATVSEIAQWRIEPKIQGAPGKGDTVCADVAIVRDKAEIETCT